jgi:Ca2+/H+ antiporter, TMEM165/GDT1 family
VTTQDWVLVAAVFGASTVEMVEALTIVLAAGTSRGWRSALEGAAAAVGVLAVLVAAVGVPLVHYVPIDALRVVVGALLLSLGMSWLRKAWLRASGHKALHDEDAIYAETVAELAVDGPRARTRDPVGFAVAFKGVFLEGTEVVLIVISLGASQGHGRLGLAAVAAVAALLIVGVIGAIVARQLSKVPENLIKLVVGIMLTSFGLFWVGEGAGIHWPGSDLFLLALVGALVVLTSLVVPWLARSAPSPSRARDGRSAASGSTSWWGTPPSCLSSRS